MQSSGRLWCAIDLEAVLSKANQSARLWELFWAEAGTHGSTASFPPAAQQAIAAKWSAYFAGLQAGSSILDVATGAGAVLAYAARALPRGASFKLTGADLASAAPAQSAWMDYKAGVDATSLPFGDQSFHYVTSQFGIEYAGFEPALMEAARVCRTGMKMLVHAAAGVVVRQNAIQADQADWILKELRLPDRLAQHFADPSLKSASKIDQLLDAIRKRAETDENVTLLESVHSAALASQQLRELKGLRPAREAIAELAAQLALHRDRMRLLGGAGITRARIEAAMADLRARGFEDPRLEEERFGADNHLVGYWLEARRTIEEGE
jgi:ubiquinone/menaquinone biosynthesis C-methylase UbiE